MNENQVLRPVGITAVAGYVPEYVLTNAELERMVDTTDAWIRERSGIEERRILKGELGSSHMAVRAVDRLLSRRGITAQSIDLIICATVTPDMTFPATANLVAHALGAPNVWGYDLEAACSSFLYALHTGAQFVRTGQADRVVIVGADKMSSIIDYTDRNTCVLFGDGAGAVLLEAVAPGLGLGDARMYSDGAGAVSLHMKAGGSRRPASALTVANREHYVYQEGKSVFKHAVVRMAEVAAEVMERNHLTANDIAYLVPHQANRRIIDATAQRMGVGPEKVMLNIQRYGNTTSATLPLCLVDYEHLLRTGDNLILATFGGGYTWGAMHVRWAYNGQPNSPLP